MPQLQEGAYFLVVLPPDDEGRPRYDGGGDTPPREVLFAGNQEGTYMLDYGNVRRGPEPDDIAPVEIFVPAGQGYSGLTARREEVVRHLGGIRFMWTETTMPSAWKRPDR